MALPLFPPSALDCMQNVIKEIGATDRVEAIPKDQLLTRKSRAGQISEEFGFTILRKCSSLFLFLLTLTTSNRERGESIAL